MADAVSLVVERLADLLVSKAKHLYGFRNEIHGIQRELQRMQIFVEVAVKRPIQDEGVRLRVSNWVSYMKELAFKAEDVIETFAMEVEHRDQKSQLTKMLGRFCMFVKATIRFQLALHDIKSALINHSAMIPTLGITNYLEGEGTSNSQVNRKSQRILFTREVDNDFFGREEQIEQIIYRLNSKDNSCQVVSICGMGGTGKTTLAKNICNHEKVRAHFNAYAWVAIGQKGPEFDEEEVLRGALRDLLPAYRRNEVPRMDNVELVRELYTVQQEKCCLIVMDDIWSVDTWISIKAAFSVGETVCGSKFLLTTRLNEVAALGDYISEMQDLSEKESLQLLYKKSGIKDIQEKKVAYEMEKIARDMIKRCKGLPPLAISALGGLLKRTSLEKWEIMKEEFFSHLGNNDVHGSQGSILNVLRLSYDSLPPRLKYCLLWFVNYKEDEVIETRELYMIWIAEGLISIEDKAEGEMMLDVAERYLNKLANLSFIQVEDSLWSKPRTCRVHDLIRDFCLMKVKEEEFMTVIHLRNLFWNELEESTIRRLSIYSSDDGDESLLKPYGQHVISQIRSVFVRKASSPAMGGSSSPAMGGWPDKILSLEKFKVLRVLTVSGYEFTIQNINNISELVYLKYLCLRHCKCKFKELPSSIGNLRNMGTLDLRVDGKITIPNVLWKLKMLKHLYLPEFFEEGGSIDKLSFAGLNELELIYNFNTKYCDAHDLLLLPKLKVFDGGIILEDNLAKEIVDYIKSREFVSSAFEGEGGGKLLISILSKYHRDMVGSNDITGEASQATPSL